MAKSDETILSLNKAIDILCCLQQAGGEMGVTEIARTLAMNKSTVHRILATLESRDMVQQNTDSGKYWLGLKIYSLGMAVSESLPIKSAAAPYIKALSQQFGEAVHLGVLDRKAHGEPRLMIIDKIQTQQFLSVTPAVGFGSPCHCAGLGKCLLAFSSDDYIEKFVGGPLLRCTDKTITNWPDLLREIELIRSQGYAIDNEELEAGLSCVAAPILNKKREVLAGISLSGPTYRIQSALPDMIIGVKKTAEAISLLAH